MSTVEAVADCQECGLPWGAILSRGTEVTDSLREIARAQMVDELLDTWRCWEGEDDLNVDPSRLPGVDAVEIVWLTEKLAKFCDEHLICEPNWVDSCWMEVDWLDVPSWLLKGRKRRIALRWDCCDIGHSELYASLGAGS